MEESTTENVTQNIEKSFDTGKLLTLGTIVGVIFIGSYIIRSYLDILRIEQLRKELNKHE